MLSKKLEHFNWKENVSCPGSAHAECLDLNGASSMEMPYQVAYASIFSSLFSCIASVLIVYSYIRLVSSVVVCF
jgi:hypothetical protein